MSHELSSAAFVADEERLNELASGAARSRSSSYVEPSDLAAIRGELPTVRVVCDVAVRDYPDKLLAAWYGRCIGCCLGKPVEEPPWTRENTRLYLEGCNAYPLTDYIPPDGTLPPGTETHWWWEQSTRGGFSGMPRDDDIDYTILNLHAIETRESELSTENIAMEWLHHLPYATTYTAERAVYRNLVNGVSPDEAGGIRNPHREWIGALIRGDVFGYVYPGRPEASASFAHRDAWLSHRANGIYGEMWAAALVSAAFACTTAARAIEVALCEIPQRSRLTEAVRTVVVSHAEQVAWEATMDRIDDELGAYGWVHTINNAAALTAALLWGEGDFSRTIGLAVEAGLDADSIGATAGSVFGALHGMGAIDEHWLAPMRGVVHTAVVEEEGNTIDGLTERTLAVAHRLERD